MKVVILSRHCVRSPIPSLRELDSWTTKGSFVMTAQLVTLDIRTRRQWRAWLAKHHTSSPGIWLVFYKRHTVVKSILPGIFVTMDHVVAAADVAFPSQSIGGSRPRRGSDRPPAQAMELRRPSVSFG